MTDIVERLRLLESGARWVCNETADTLENAADKIERLRAAVAAAYKIGGKEALLHALHPEFGSIYDADGEATAAFNKGRREGIEAAIEIVERTISPWSIAASDECAFNIRALLEGK